MGVRVNFKYNLVTSLLSQTYSSLIGIIVLPFYINAMGVEAYGLVGFFLMLQMLFAMLDLGLTPTISREMSRFQGNAITATQFLHVYKTLRMAFYGVALAGGGILFFLAPYIAHNWLKPQTLLLSEIQFAICIMAFTVSLRWMSGLYRGLITGTESLIWLSGFNAIINTLRFVVVLPVMWEFGSTPQIFFSFQLFVVLIELFFLWFKATNTLPEAEKISTVPVHFLSSIKTSLTFSATIGVTSLIWIVVSQLDKLLLSRLLSLEEYGYFSLAVMVASGVVLMATPLGYAIMPRLARLEAEKNEQELIRIYRNTTQYITILAGALTATLFCCAEPLLIGWLGKPEIAKQVAPILSYYALGNGIFILTAFPYYLQYAKGNLKLHLIGHILMLVTLIPALVLLVRNYGAQGAAYAWILVNSGYFIFWTAVIHRRFIPGLHFKWLVHDIAFTVFALIGVGCIYSLMPIHFESRMANLIEVCCFCISAVIIPSISKRSFIHELIQKLRARKTVLELG